MSKREEVRNQIIHIGWIIPKNFIEFYALYRLYCGMNTKYSFDEIMEDIGIPKSKRDSFNRSFKKPIIYHKRMEIEAYLTQNKTYMLCILDFYKNNEVNFTT